VIRTAFVLGAGLGTRLRPLTLRRPKPLIPVANRPLITCAFDHLLGAGIERFVVNTHWRAEAYPRAFPQPSYRGAPIAFREETPEILETAGGMKNVADLLGDAPFIVYNGDILTDLPLAPAFERHASTGDEVTLVLRRHDGPLQVACDEASGRILDIGRRLDPAREPRFLFTGIYLVEPAFLRRIPPATKIGVVPVFCEMIRTGAKLGGVVIDDGRWWDLGSREQYLEVHRVFASGAPGFPCAPWIERSAHISPDAKIEGATAIGTRARVGDGARLRDCIIWDDAEVADGAVLERCIVADHTRADGTAGDRDFA
jgi:NDP-sugar pyrophosphorylase family protein